MFGNALRECKKMWDVWGKCREWDCVHESMSIDLIFSKLETSDSIK